MVSIGANGMEDGLEISYKHEGEFADFCSVAKEK